MKAIKASCEYDPDKQRLELVISDLPPELAGFFNQALRESVHMICEYIPGETVNPDTPEGRLRLQQLSGD